MRHFRFQACMGRTGALALQSRHGVFIVRRRFVGDGGRPPITYRPPGFTALFNGKDFTGWKVPEGDGGHWKVEGGVIDYDAQSEASRQ